MKNKSRKNKAMKKLTKKEEKELSALMKQMADCMLRMPRCRKMLVDKGWIIEDVSDALKRGEAALAHAGMELVSIQDENEKLTK